MRGAAVAVALVVAGAPCGRVAARVLELVAPQRPSRRERDGRYGGLRSRLLSALEVPAGDCRNYRQHDGVQGSTGQGGRGSEHDRALGGGPGA